MKIPTKRIRNISGPFLPEYTIFGLKVVATVFDTKRFFNEEKKLTTHLKRASSKSGWRFLKVDTDVQIGFPDVLLLKKERFWLIESKILKKKNLIKLEDDLKWQPIQISFMVDALRRKLNYSLFVGFKKQLCVIQGDYLNDNNSANHPDSFGCV